MPCALTEPDNYPDYLKAILQEVANGDDKDLKTCACQLKSPAGEDGCLIVDEDQKVALFPGCLVIEEVYGQFFTLKEIMKLYWMTKDITFKMDFIWGYLPNVRGLTGSFSDTLSFVESPVYVNGQMQPLQSKKNIEKVCPLGIYKGAYGEITITPTPRKKGEENLYSLDINGDGRKGMDGIVPVWMFSMGLNGSGFTWGFDETGPDPISAILSLTANFYDGTSLKLN